jgi:quercetin dioxygenase-like cupin family protein
MPTTFETPNAVMHTYASPALTGSPLAVWRTEMAPGAAGPLHSASTEQVLVVLEGELGVSVAGRAQALRPGEAIVLQAGAERRLHNAGAGSVAFLACAPPAATATVPGREPVPIPWAA